MPTKDLTLMDLVDQFATEDDCHEFLAELRWPEGVRCPQCGHDGVSYLKKRRQYDCNKCRKRFSVRAGTIFNDSHLPLRKWFMAVYIMVQSKKCVSALQLKRMLGVSYKTAWYLCHRIRVAMFDEDAAPLSGVIEVDETFVGGKKRKQPGKRTPRLYGPRSDKFANKTIVMTAVERDGNIRLGVVKSRRRVDIERFLREHTSDVASYYTDELSSYDELGNAETRHETVTHSEGEWVNAKVHTNTAEGVFSLLKRSIVGSFHKVSRKHLPAYLHEIEWRYNNRANPYLFRDTMLELIRAEPMEYKKLVA